MKKQSQKCLLGLVLILCTLPAYAKPPQPKAAKSTSWQDQMQQANRVLNELLEDLNSDERFNDEKNFSRIKKNFLKMKDVAKDIAHAAAPGSKAPEADPSVAMIAGLFSGEMQRAYAALESGKRTYARHIMKGATGYCTLCHVLNDAGPNLSTGLKAGKKLGQKEAPATFESGQFLVATRRFDDALSVFEKVMKGKLHPTHMDRAVHYALAIAVRVKKDPALARKFAELAASSSGSPYFLKQDAAKWIESVKEWEHESSKKVTQDDQDSLYQEALRLLQQAHQVQKYPADRGADILYLRASAALHNLMSTAPKGKYAAEALYLTGICYEVLGDLDIDDLHEVYFESCIHTQPHSETASRCYQRYERSTYLGYSGSEGVFLPKDVESKLKILKELSTPSNTIQ